jgi:hypothetical protein
VDLARKGAGAVAMDIPKEVFLSGHLATAKYAATKDKINAAVSAAVEKWEEIRCQTLHPGRMCDCGDDRMIVRHSITLIPSGAYWYWRCVCGQEGDPYLSVPRAAAMGKLHQEGR